ncbi:hypothetical protein O3G_MSEX001975 [Manduca sexta]|uniref:Uncharacterized protein n=1 Tax=Manduca sexta TaxID=7130 RepID=A0A922CDW3_MANSE|nr:hypothetical protein O3G_MSEX001975 [Manduca sexta]
MDREDDVSLLELIPTTKYCCFCIDTKCGTKLIAIVGILFALTMASLVLLKDRKYLTFSTAILIALLSIFIMITVMFVIVSMMLLVAAFDENPDLMSYYIWLTVVYLCVQLILAIVVPIVLVIDGVFHVAIALIWVVIVMIVVLGWMHFISVVSCYRKSLI